MSELRERVSRFLIDVYSPENLTTAPEKLRQAVDLLNETLAKDVADAVTRRIMINLPPVGAPTQIMPKQHVELQVLSERCWQHAAGGPVCEPVCDDPSCTEVPEDKL